MAGIEPPPASVLARWFYSTTRRLSNIALKGPLTRGQPARTTQHTLLCRYARMGLAALCLSP